MKRVFVSDVHMGAGRSLAAGYRGHVYDWLSKQEAEAFAAFLKFLIEDKTIHEVILLGDIMDTWVCPVDIVPPTFEEIIRAGVNRPIVRNLRTLAGETGKKVIYVAGNHDMAIRADLLRRKFPGMQYLKNYSADGLRAEHGNDHTLFCAPDAENDPRHHLPLGYFISRIAATNAARTGSDNSFRYFVDEFMEELVDSRTLVEAVFEALTREAGLSDETDIVMTPNKSVTIGEVKEKYKDIYSQWRDDDHLVKASEALAAELGFAGLSAAARRANAEYGCDIIIFGHTHSYRLEKVHRYDDWDSVYISANCGTWCDYEERERPFTFIETEETGDKHYVKLKAWDKKEGKPIRLRPEEFVDR